jgi:hypothetical protein
MPKIGPLSPRQLVAFHVPGTVPFPSPFPEMGTISLLPRALVYRESSDDPGQDLVLIEHVQSNRVTILRRVRLDDVAVVMFSSSDATQGVWFVGPQVARALRERSNGNDASLMRGIAYVHERAPVLMQVEVGMTAAESAEYYPPVVGERSDAHYHLQTAAGMAPTTSVLCGCGVEESTAKVPSPRAFSKEGGVPCGCDFERP